MLEVGLTPSHTGEPGGKMTGQRMSDYPTPDGVFLKALVDMPEKYKLPFVSTESVQRKSGSEGSTTKSKVKYTCPICGVNVWGKPDLNVICGNCQHIFIQQS